MKNTLLALVTLLFLALSQARAGQGGPDLYGYTWIDSNEPGGPAYSWWDISIIGVKVHPYLGDDNVALNSYSFGGNFTYYWYPVDECFISSNGYITFEGDNIAAPFPTIPNSAGADNFIAVLMSDLNFSGAANAECYFYANNDSVCISWINVPFWSLNPASSSNSFQVILNKVDNSITMNYMTQTGTTMNNDITIGIENINGAIGLQHSKNVYPASGYTIKYIYPSNPTLTVVDGAARWNSNNQNKGIFIKRNGPAFPLVTNVANVGNQVISGMQLSGAVINPANTTVVSTSASTLSMTPGQDTTITFPSTFTPTSSGSYSFRTTLSGITGDTAVSNDVVIQEVVSVDTAFATITLTYAGPVANGPGLSWNGGNGGIGVYFKPPTYPAKMISTRYTITSNPNNAGFFAKIYADDGLFGGPGTLIDSVSVSSAQINVGGTTIVPLSTPRMIYSGGVYVLWYMNGQNISLGNDLTGPFSFQTYEVLGNIWSEYRAHEREDFFISLDYQKAFIEDAGVPVIVSPAANSTVMGNTQVQVWVRNYGGAPESNFTVNYRYGSNPVVSQTYTGPVINAGDSVLFTFSTPFPAATNSTDNFCVWTYKSTDFDASNDTACINITTSTLGLEDISGSEEILVFPNPAQDKIQLLRGAAVSDGLTFMVYDIAGQLVLSERMEGGALSYTIDISSLPAGAYTYLLHQKDITKAGKLIRISE